MGRVVIVVAACALAIAGAASAQTSARSAAAPPATWTDKSGDSGTAPDIGQVQAAYDDASGQLTVSVGVPAAATATGAPDVVYVYLNTDGNASTGAPSTDGADYVLAAYQDDNGWGFSRWDGSSWADTPSDTVHVYNLDGGGIGFSVNRSELGNAAKVSFWVESDASRTDYGDGQNDQAPDKSTWSFTLAPMELKVDGWAATKPVAGSDFSFALLAKRSDSGTYVDTGGTISCRAAVGGKALALASSGFLNVPVKGVQTPVATCIWPVGKRLKGKTLTATIKVTLGDRSVAKSFSYRIR